MALAALLEEDSRVADANDDPTDVETASHVDEAGVLLFDDVDEDDSQPVFKYFLYIPRPSLSKSIKFKAFKSPTNLCVFVGQAFGSLPSFFVKKFKIRINIV